MCYMCPQAGATPSTPVPPARPRQRTEPGEHAYSAIAARNYIRCNESNHKVWFTSTGPLCGGCGHALEGELRESAEQRLKNRLRSQIGRLNNLVADDWDESEEGTKQMASQLRATFPYLRLAAKSRRRILFRIATLQHQLDACDSGSTMTAARYMETTRRLANKIETEIEALLEVAFK